jgi:hypothetical protein
MLVSYSIVWGACTQERQPCLTPKIATLTMECMHKLTDTSTVFVDTALPTARFAAYSLIGERDIIYTTQNSNFTISLSSSADSCKWGMKVDTSSFANNFDTLTFFYRRKLQFISNACSYMYFYNVDSVHTTHRMIDSVLITNANVNTNVSSKHLRIYIHPDF